MRAQAFEANSDGTPNFSKRQRLEIGQSNGVRSTIGVEGDMGVLRRQTVRGRTLILSIHQLADGDMGRPGLSAWLAQLSLTQTLRPFEQGLLSSGLVFGIAAVVGGLAALTIVWLPPGTPVRVKMIRSGIWVLVIVAGPGAATQIKASVDLSEDRRNSFSSADERLLATLQRPLVIRVNLATEDPRYVDLRRNVLGKLERAMALLEELGV